MMYDIDLCLKFITRFRQYGLWDRYTDLYPDQDLVYTVETSVYQTDWYFAHVNRYLYYKYNVYLSFNSVDSLENCLITFSFSHFSRQSVVVGETSR